MSDTIDKLGARPLPLRKVVLLGPVPDGSDGARPLWTLFAGAPAFYADDVDNGALPATALDQLHPLRVLAAGAAVPAADGFPSWQRPELLGLHLIVGSKNERYAERHDPNNDYLLFGWGVNNTATANLGDLLKTQTEAGDSIVDEAQFVQVVAEPLPAGSAGWPPQKPGEIRVPPLRLVGGRVGLRVRLRDQGTQRMDWLTNLGIVLEKNWASIWLVPDGIEFKADLPFPGQAGRLRATVLLHAVMGDNKPEYRLTFLAAEDSAAWHSAWQAITPAADGNSLAGLAFSARRGGALPAFVWPLAGMPGASPIADADGIRVGADAFSLSLRGTARKDGDDGAAELALPWLKITPGKTAGTVAFHFEAGVAPKPAMTMTYECAPDKLTFSSDPGSDILLGIDGHRLAGELRAAYGLPTPPTVPAQRAPGAAYGPDYGRPLIPAFVALRDGWLQFPVPNLGALDTASDQVLGKPGATDSRPSVLRGFCRFRPALDTTTVQSASRKVGFGPLQAPWTLTVERADSVSGDIQATIGKPGAAGAALLSARILLGGPRLSARGLLWMSADRPDALEALPRLGAGPGAFIDAQLESIGPGDTQQRDILTAAVTALQVESGTTAQALGWRQLRLLFNRKAARWGDELLKPAEARAALRAAGQCIAGPTLFPAPDPAASGMSWRYAAAVASAGRARNGLGQLGQAFAAAAADLAVLERYALLRDKAKKARQAIAAADTAATAVGDKLAPAEAEVTAMGALLDAAAPLDTRPWPAVAWLRHDAIPLAAQMPMTRAAAGAVRPLESRDLLPFAMLRNAQAAEDPVLLAVLQPAAGPLLALDPAQHALQLAARWPLDVPAKKGALPERGVALAAVGMAGVELRVAPGAAAAGAAPAFQAAVRYDLPLLDEAYATASLPPVAGPASGAAPPRPPATALDWPLLADLWDEQERKLQQSRVADSYLCGYLPVDSKAKPTIANLVRPMTWSPEVKVTAGRSDLPYGTLELAGESVSGNAALAGYSGRIGFTADGATVDVDVLGFSPSAFPDPGGRGFDLDNRGAGAALLRQPSAQVLAREVTYPGAQPSARLVSLAAPVNVTLAGLGFSFWFKDLLFAGDTAVLPDGRDLDFGLFDDAGKVVKAGREWRFAPTTALDADTAFAQGHDEIPFLGFWLQPLRLVGATLDHDSLATATLECRLALGRRGMTLGGGANLVKLTLAAAAGAPGAVPAVVASFGKASLEFHRAASFTWPGAPGPSTRRIVITASLAAGAAFTLQGDSMTIDIAGVPLQLGAPVVAINGPDHLVTFTAAPAATDVAPGAGVLRVSRASLSDGHIVETVDGKQRLRDRVPGLALESMVIIRCAMPAPGTYQELIRWPLNGQDALALLGQSFSAGLAPPEEGDGALALQAASRPGLADTAPRLSLALICRLGAQSGANGAAAGDLALVSGQLDGSLVQAAKGGSALFGPGIALESGRCDFTCARVPDGAGAGTWDGVATVHGVLKAESAVRWPHLKTGPSTVPLPGKDASARVGVTLDAGQPAKPASVHAVEWQLAGHRLPLALACAIAADKSTALWTIPVLSRHTLARQGRTRAWSGVETIALGRPRAIVPPPAPAGQDVTTFAARYLNKYPGNPKEGDTPGMRWAGLGDVGTVLHGSLGAAFRQMYWKDGAKRGDALMVAGGFLGVLRYRRGEPGRLVRLPVLAGAAGLGADGLAQTGFGGNTIQLHWSDGPAARAVALTRPTAPSPANGSYGALCAALIAGSLPTSPLQDGESLSDAVMAMLVEQSFDDRDPAAAAGPDTPFFLASAIEIDRLLQPAGGDDPLEALSLFAGSVSRARKGGAPQTVPLAAALSLRDTVMLPRPAAGPAQLAVLGDGLARRDWTGPSVQESEAPLAPAIAAYSTAMDAGARAWMLKRPVAGDVAAYVVGILPSLALDRPGPATLPVRPFADDGRGPMGAPAADGILRWLAAPAEGRVTPQRDLRQEQGGGYSGSGLAGLSRTLHLPEQAGGPAGGGDASRSGLVWLSQTQAPIYLPLKTTGLAGPAIGWLQAANPRQRLPVDAEVADALAPSEHGGAAPQSFLPGPLQHCAIGERAGILTLRRTRLLTRLDTPQLRHVDAFDAEIRRFGGPAQAGSSFGRTYRTPRPGTVPPNRDPSVPDQGDAVAALPDRRIQASLVRPLSPFAAYSASTDVVQGRGGAIGLAGGGKRPLAAWSIVVLASPGTCSVVSDRWDGSLAVVCRLEILLDEAAAAGALAPPLSLLHAILLPLKYDTDPQKKKAVALASASLKIGASEIRMRWIELRRADPAWTSDGADPAAPALRFAAEVVLVLDPRVSEAYGPAETPAAIRDALDGRAGLPPAELQFIVPAAMPAVTDTPAEPGPVLAPGMACALASDAGGKPPALAGGPSGAPLTLRMPLYPVTQAHGALPLTAVSLLFHDPAYNRDLAGPPASHIGPVAVAAADVQAGRGALLFELAADRASAMLNGTVTFMLDLRYERRLDEIAQRKAEDKQTAPGGDLDLSKAAPRAAVLLRIEAQGGGTRVVGFDAGPLAVDVGLVYELPLARLVEANGSPAALRPGDMLVIEATIPAPATAWLWNPGGAASKQVTLQLDGSATRSMRIMLTADPVVEPPPALYAALLRTPAAKDHRLELALHAQSPLPARVLLVEPARCFRAGMMKRHADFIWVLARPAALFGPNSLYVIKSDRNGQAYWPASAGEFLAPVTFKE
jgi:hypothetical protein